MEESGCGLMEILFWHLSGRTKENPENSVTIAGVPVRIQTEHLLIHVTDMRSRH
jgi:hypothetical protein